MGLSVCFFSKWITFFFDEIFFWSNELIQFEIKAFADTLHFTDAIFFLYCLTHTSMNRLSFSGYYPNEKQMVTIKQGCTLHVAHFHAYFNRPCLTIDIKLSNIIIIIILLIRIDMDRCVFVCVCIWWYIHISMQKVCVCVYRCAHWQIMAFRFSIKSNCLWKLPFFAIITNEFFLYRILFLF